MLPRFQPRTRSGRRVARTLVCARKSCRNAGVFRPVLVIPFCSLRRALRIPLPVVQCGEHGWEGDAARYFRQDVTARIAKAFAARGIGPLAWSTATIELTLASEPSATA